MKLPIIIIITTSILIVIIAVITTIILFHNRRWPLKFSLGNSSDPISLNIYVNSSKLVGSPFYIKKGEQINFEIGGKNNAINPLTQSYFTRQQVKNITIELSKPGGIHFLQENFPKYTFTGSPNLAGFAPFDTNVGNYLYKPGFYQIQFDKIPFL